MQPSLPSIASFFLLATTLAAQRTWVVDASNGPGTTHTDLPPAIAAAADGDTILVRAGSYSQFTTNKALRILGRTGASVAIKDQKVQQAVQISGIGAGKTFVLKGLRVVGWRFRAPREAIRISNCAGLVHLDRLVIPAACRTVLVRTCHSGIRIIRCTQVMISDSSVQALDPVFADGSTVSICRSKLTAEDSKLQGRGLAKGPSPNSPALLARSSTVTLSTCTLRGGGGLSVGQLTRPGQPAIQATSSSITIAGTGADTYTAGQPAFRQSTPTSAIAMSNGRLWVASAVKLVPNSGAPPVSGTHVRLPGTPVGLCAQSAPPGGVLQVRMVATPKETAYLLVAFPAAPVPTKWGALWLDPGSMAILAQTQVGSAGTWNVAVPVPPISALRGLEVAFQALSGIPNHRLHFERLSNGLVVVLD